MIISICSEPKVLEITTLINIFINIIRTLVPLLLIFSISFKFISVIKIGNEDKLSEVKKGTINNIVAAIIIFLIPNIISIIVKITFPQSDYKNCLSSSYETINNAYNDKQQTLTSKAEETLNINDYYNAVNYLNNIKDEDKKNIYKTKLDEIKEKIDELNKKSYDKVNYSNFKWIYYDRHEGPLNNYYSDSYPYAIWAPEDPKALNGASLPLLIWLHGAGEMRVHNCLEECFFTHGLPPIIMEWDKTGLKEFPAIIIAPQMDSDGWYDDRASITIRRSIDYAEEVYNINRKNVVLMGHSSGGSGVVYISRKNQDLFSALVIMSGFEGFNGYEDYYKNIPLRGYMSGNPARAPEGGDGNTGMENAFNKIGRLDDLKILPRTVSHIDVPRASLILDEDNDGVSDLVYWMFRLDEE